MGGVREDLAFDEVGDRVGPLFDQVAGHFDGGPSGVALATYAMADGRMVVEVGFTLDDGQVVPDGLELIELPAVEAGACTLHLGPVDGIFSSWQRLHAWAREAGYEFGWPSREVYVVSESPDMHDWVTDLQQPLVAN
jgi:predicted transcriptional regulator YdeE